MEDEKMINSVYLTHRNDIYPIMNSHVEGDGVHVDLHIQVINVTPGMRYMFSLKALGPEKQSIAENTNWFEMTTPREDGYTFGEIVIPLDLDRTDIESFDRVVVSVTIKESKQSVVLFLGGQDQ
jgi:hypothetical protein